MTQKSPTPEHVLSYRPDIDGLRAIAVIGVVIFHAFPDLLPGGFFGVDVFFVISGFLITGLITKKIEAGQFTILDFYRRRALRLFPSLLTVFAFVFAFGWFLYLPDPFSRLGKSLLSGSAFVANIYFLRQGGYFDTAALTKPLLHLWSLGIEEQFYFVFPVFLFGLNKWALNRKPWIFFVGALSFVCCIYLTYTRPEKAFYLPTSRMWELLVGSLCSLGVFHIGKPLRGFASGLGLALIAVSFLYRGYLSLPGFWALLPCIGTALVVLSGPSALLNRALALGPVVFIGLISYPLYLWHWPLLAMNYNLADRHPSASANLLFVAAAVVLAILTRRFIENPLRFTSHPARISLRLAIGLFLSFSVGVGLWLSKGLPQRFDPSIRPYVTLLGNEFESAVRSDVCHLQHIPFEKRAAACVDSKRPLLAFWGDSHAAALYPGLQELSQEEGLGLTQLTEAGCPPILDRTGGPDQQACEAINRDALEKLIQNKPDVVLVASAWAHELYGMPVAEVGEKLSKTLAHLKNVLPHSRIVLLGPAPRWSKPVQEVVFDYWKGHAHEIPVGATDFELRRDVLDREAVIRQVAADAGVAFLSVQDAFCSSGKCSVLVGRQNELISFDDWHLTPAASKVLIAKQRDQILGWLVGNGAEISQPVDPVSSENRQ